MRARIRSIPELSQTLASAHARAERIPPLDLDELNEVVACAPEDMTVTVQAGLKLQTLQNRLKVGNQWLPVDPPHPDRLSVGALLATNASGPRRFAHGTIREHLLGIKVLLADGTLIKSGGQVVKNVAGYDLCKLFVGSFGTLGIIVEATFKVLPLPETESFLCLTSPSAAAAGKVIQSIKQLSVNPVLLELDNIDHSSGSPNLAATPDGAVNLLVGFAGTRDETDWQSQQLPSLGFTPCPPPSSYELFWDNHPRILSVPPSHLIDAIGTIQDCPFIARAGNGILYYLGSTPPATAPVAPLPLALMKRIKTQFDPKGILMSLEEMMDRSV